MRKLARRLTALFAAGCLGGLAKGVAIWLAATYGLTRALEAPGSSDLATPWVYPRIIWGGLWGLLFLFPFLSSSIILKGLLLSLGPTLVQLFDVLPFKAFQETVDIQIGSIALLVAYNAVWGIIAALWIKYVS